MTNPENLEAFTLANASGYITRSITVDANDLPARLPPLRDDEPPSLRQDILDELADHLACAERRELLATNDAAQARQRVLDKFGDPREVARKLWWQAMWSRIMSQRWLLGAMSVLIVICLCLTGTVLWQMQQQRAAMIDQQRLIAETLERMAALSEAKANEASQPPPAPAPSSIKVRMTLDKPDGPPAVGCFVSLRRLGVDKDFGPEVRSDEQGIVDFGYFEPAKYSISIRTNRSSMWKSTSEFLLPLSTAHVETVICPSDTTQPIRWTAALPEDLDSQGVQAFLKWKCSLNCGGRDWLDVRDQDRVQEFPFRTSDGESPRVNLINAKSEWQSGGTPGSVVFARITPSGSPLSVADRVAVPFYRTTMSQPKTTDCIGVRFHSLRLVLVARAPLSAVDRINQQRNEFQLRLMPIAPSVAKLSEEERQLNQPPQLIKRKLEWVELKDEFVVSGDKPNQWTIRVPDELIEQARAYLKEHPVAASDELTK